MPNNVAHPTVTDVCFHGVIPHAKSTDVSSSLVNTLKAIPVKKKKSGKHSAGHGVCYIPRASTSSSNRQKAAYQKSRIMTITVRSRVKKNKARKYALKAQKQKSHLLSIDLPPLSDRIFITQEGMSAGVVFVDGGNEDNPPILRLFPKEIASIKRIGTFLSYLFVIFKSPLTISPIPKRGCTTRCQTIPVISSSFLVKPP